MTLTADLTVVEKALDALEQREARVLVWGLVDSALADDEVHDVLRKVLEREDLQEIQSSSDYTIEDTKDLVRRLTSLGLLFEVPQRQLKSQRRWRTRMAEGIRLLSRLRQLMPKHEGPVKWVTAPTLVADYRLLWRPRKYPKRNLGMSEVSDELEQVIENPETQKALRHWLGKARPDWKLSRFQLEATARILKSLKDPIPCATLVSAGTGSGKTLAFYMPALSWLAGQKMALPNVKGVQVLAIYPRNELLKDQLSEVYEQARKFDDLLSQQGSRPISVGVLYGDTPNNLKSIRYSWKTGVCPFFRCPKPGCSQTMVVTQADTESGLERLTCSACGHHVDDDTLRLTRESMQKNPPDILFTSVEMLNQRMADSNMRHLFGLGPQRTCTPSLVLLDEVHVYSGTYGAQVGHLLRRWNHLAGRKARFVGLSATITEGERYFGALVGLSERVVKEIKPRPEDLESEGAEYLVALRGDPVSQAALLSTSIQALMLGSRLLDTRAQFDQRTRPFGGWRAFAFTDQMDATNRLFVDLLDAEGRNANGSTNNWRHPHGGLARLRSMDALNFRRYEAGQDWRMPALNGHDLSTKHKVGRTTAYDTGVAVDTEIVVATAALEVGYDDDAVGLVLQHKAPRDLAQFLQRKGRAGRTRHMRPWTIMVLSDYGRDRLAYQSYETFFDPELPARDLPMGNRYVQRMQAAYALIDYLGIKTQKGFPKGSIWQDLSGPPALHLNISQRMREELKRLVGTKAFPIDEQEAKKLENAVYQVVRTAKHALATSSARKRLAYYLRIRYLKKLLAAFINQPEEVESFTQHLMYAMGLRREVVDALLWKHPRPILLEVVPTALRRIERNWEANGESEADYRTGNPLPEFVPATLFSDLCLPEVRIDRPRADRDSFLAVQQAIGEMAPGKVSKRYDDALWLGMDEDQLQEACLGGKSEHDVDAEISVWYDLDTTGSFYEETDGRIDTRLAFRPRTLKLRPPPGGPNQHSALVKQTSNARIVWSSQVFARRTGREFYPPKGKVGIVDLISTVFAHTHTAQCPATVRRYAVGSRAELRTGGSLAAAIGEKPRINFRFVHEGKPAGVGFEIDVDALRFELNIPRHPHKEIELGDGPTLRALRTARYFWELRYGDVLQSIEPNMFVRNWMGDIFLTGVMQHCLGTGEDLLSGLDHVSSHPDHLKAESILDVLFQSPQASDDGNDQSDEGRSPDALRQTLIDTIKRPDVIAALRSIGAHLVEEIGPSWDPWLLRVIKDTLAAAVLEAIQTCCPQVDTDDLVVDVRSGPTESGDPEVGHRMWITEANPGGNGLIEQVIDALAIDPVGFYRQIEGALDASEFEIIDSQLRDFIHRIGDTKPEWELLRAVHAVRNSESTTQAHEAITEVRKQLVAIGHSVFHGYVAALANRLLRPGTPNEFDSFLADFIREWTRLESHYRVEIDARVICALFSEDRRIDSAFGDAGVDLPPEAQRGVWRFSILMGVIWARGHALRSNALPLRQRYERIDPVTTERLLLRRWLTPEEVPVDALKADWRIEVHEALKVRGRACIRVPKNKRVLDSVVQELITTPIQLEYLNVYCRLAHVHRSVDAIVLMVELVEERR